MSGILNTVDTPAVVGKLAVRELDQLAQELRERIIATVSRCGGHLAANLGAVELTIALLRVFDPASDKIIWDVGHQTYAWKLLTGRRERFDSLRQPGGISGFPRRDESPYDAFGGGHAGTALSAALGMAVARDRRGSSEYVVAVIGDAAMGNGISLEALNNIEGTTNRLIIVLNDNEMSISGNVGSLSRHLGQLLTNPKYNRWKGSAERMAQQLRMSPLRGIYHRTEKAIKSLFLQNALFEEFGVRYTGPIDGHDHQAIADALNIAKGYDRPILLHVATQKGRGYQAAEESPERWHGVGRFDVAKAELVESEPGYSKIFGDGLTRLADRDPQLVAITAAMSAGTGLDPFAARHPTRFFDVGICEEHAVVFAAGLAAEGMRPVVALYSSFMQRAVDCVLHDVCLQKLPVTFCLDRAGVVGADGPTHHGIFDIPMLRGLPGLVLMQPKDEPELARMLVTAVRHNGPAVIRYPRDRGPGVSVPDDSQPLAIGQAEVIEAATSENVCACDPALGPGRAGATVARAEPSAVIFWALGDMLPLACAAATKLRAAGVAAGVVNARFIKPLDTRLLAEQATPQTVFVTLENGVVAGGFGSAVQEALAEQGRTNLVVRCGWPDEVIGQGTTATLMAAHGLTPEAVAARVLERLGRAG
ncbi:MAG: 1-deoxy-D-xylulose-5-phosphate synthase [Kiritimatiellia bacterium]